MPNIRTYLWLSKRPTSEIDDYGKTTNSRTKTTTRKMMMLTIMMIMAMTIMVVIMMMIGPTDDDSDDILFSVSLQAFSSSFSKAYVIYDYKST